MTRLFISCLAAWAIGAATPVLAQTPSGREPLQLGALQRAAREADARTRELDLLARQTDLMQSDHALLGLAHAHQEDTGKSGGSIDVAICYMRHTRTDRPIYRQLVGRH